MFLVVFFIGVLGSDGDGNDDADHNVDGHVDGDGDGEARPTAMVTAIAPVPAPAPAAAVVNPAPAEDPPVVDPAPAGPTAMATTDPLGLHNAETVFCTYCGTQLSKSLCRIKSKSDDSFTTHSRNRAGVPSDLSIQSRKIHGCWFCNCSTQSFVSRTL